MIFIVCPRRWQKFLFDRAYQAHTLYIQKMIKHPETETAVKLQWVPILYFQGGYGGGNKRFLVSVLPGLWYFIALGWWQKHERVVEWLWGLLSDQFLITQRLCTVQIVGFGVTRVFLVAWLTVLECWNSRLDPKCLPALCVQCWKQRCLGGRPLLCPWCVMASYEPLCLIARGAELRVWQKQSESVKERARVI